MFTDTLGPRTLPAWKAILGVLADHDWHTHAELYHAAAEASDLADKTIDKIIRGGWRARHYRRRKPPGQEAKYRLPTSGHLAEGPQ